MKTLGQRIKEARKAAELTQVVAAKKAKVSQVFWSNLECDNRLPRLEVLRRVAKVLGVAVSVLMGE